MVFERNEPARRRRLAALAASLVVPGSAFADTGWYFQSPATPIARQIESLHDLIFWICVVIFVGVFGTMFYSLFKHRKSVGHQAVQFHENTAVEIIWTVIPFLILLFMAWPATKTILNMHDTAAADMTIKVTGYQWKWNYDYVQDGFGYYSTLATPLDQIEGRAPKDEHYLLEVDNPLVVPVDTKVRVLVTANDVIHSWWVPAFGIKQDAIPGFVRDTWFRADKVGIYRGQCAELCGKEHGFMPVVVDVKSKDDYAKWLAEQKQKLGAAAQDATKVWDVKDLVAHGEQVFTANCAACHQANGTGNTALGAPALVGDKVVLGPEQHQIDVVLNGQTNGVVQKAPTGGKMPSWAHLSDVDVASVITYTRNTWGNKAQQNVVQPSAVKAERK
ncbi:MAG TPA: cytochrome c oxidase subunit II [Casimicrobiaceae bacterium]|nr:cytochrome c oxidase subunit II [Casimicrobiaceae bacterium]